MLDECLGFLENRRNEVQNFTYEVIVVSDGSKDKTAEVALQYVKDFGVEKIRLLDLKQNRGKGGAVRLVCFILYKFLNFFLIIIVYYFIYFRVY